MAFLSAEQRAHEALLQLDEQGHLREDGGKVGDDLKAIKIISEAVGLVALIQCAEAAKKYLKANIDRDEVAEMYAQRDLNEALNKLTQSPTRISVPPVAGRNTEQPPL